MHQEFAIAVGTSEWRITPLHDGAASVCQRRLDLVTDKHVSQLSRLAFLFAGVFAAEGFGLAFNQRWAKYLTVVVTASFIPIELYETLRHFGFGKLILLVLNTAIVALLVSMLRKELREESAHRTSLGTQPALTAIASEDLT